MKKTTIVARAKAAPGKEQDFMNLAKPLIEATRKEDGNISYTLYQNLESVIDFIFYEEYQDVEATKLHANSEHFKAFAGEVKSLLAEDLIIETF